MKINGFGKRFLSLLLAMVALVGLLSVGAMAEGTTEPKVTLSIENVKQSSSDDSKYTADVYLRGDFDPYDPEDEECNTAIGGVNLVTTALEFSAGLELVSLSKKEAISVDSSDGSIQFISCEVADGDIMLGVIDAYLAKVTFKVKNGAFGKQSVSFDTNSIVSDANGAIAWKQASYSFELPSVMMHYYYQGHGGTDCDVEMAQGAIPVAPSPAPTATGYNFGGWYKQNACAEEFDFNQPLEEDGYAYAKWTAKNTNVTLNVDGGALPEGFTTGLTFTYDEGYTLPRPSRTGFRFGGWKTPDGTTIAQTGTWNREDENLALKAAWVPKGDVPVKLDTQTYTYNGERHPFELESTNASELPDGISVQYSEQDKNIFSTTAPTEVGTYDVKLGRAEDDEYNALDKASTLVIEKATVALPTLKTNSFEYDGNNHTVKLSESSVLYTLDTSSATAKDKGEYWAKVMINEDCVNNYKWASLEGRDDVRAVADDPDSIELKYTITAKKITAPAAESKSYTYNGENQTYQLTLGEGMELAADSDEQTQKNAGTYTIKVALTDKENTTWSDGATEDKAYTFTIKKAELALPELTSNSFEWTGTAPAVTLKSATDSGKYELEASSVTATDKGNYDAKVTIKATEQGNYKWVGELDDTVTVKLPYTITAKKITPPTAGTGTYTYNGDPQTYVFATEGDKTEYTVTGNKQTNADNHTVTVALKDKKNTTWLDGTTADKEYTFTITKADQTAPTGLTTDPESIYKKGDGKLKGLDKALMEYKLKGSTAEFVQPAREEITLPAGTYEVRYAEDPNHNASPVTEVTIAEGRKLTVTFNTVGGSTVAPQTNLGYGDPVTKPDPAPDHTGFTLVGWYKDADYKNVWDFATDRVEDDTELYAKWEVSIGIEGGASFTEGKAPAEGVKIIVGKGLDQTETPTLDLKKVTVDGKKLDAENYTAVYDKNGLTITLKQEYLNTLEDDEYEIGVVADSEHLGKGRKLAVTLTVDPEQIEAEGGKPAGKPGKAVKTGDSSDLLLWSILSLGAGAGLVCIGKKRREN